MKEIKKSAFTLAEVLIALTIIGVIAAITIPALIQRTNKQEYVTALQKTYSVLSQAANQIIAEHGSPKCDDEGWACSSDEIYNLFKKYLNNVKECGTGRGCFNDINYKGMNGILVSVNHWDRRTDLNKLMLSDGVQVLFILKSKTCEFSEYGSSNVCGRILVDLNGNKKPNIAGRDLFGFAIKENGLFPWGCDDETAAQCNETGNGFGCACRVLSEGAMNY